jgi:hypothetical protein
MVNAFANCGWPFYINLCSLFTSISIYIHFQLILAGDWNRSIRSVKLIYVLIILSMGVTRCLQALCTWWSIMWQRWRVWDSFKCLVCLSPLWLVAEQPHLERPCIFWAVGVSTMDCDSFGFKAKATGQSLILRLMHLGPKRKRDRPLPSPRLSSLSTGRWSCPCGRLCYRYFPTIYVDFGTTICPRLYGSEDNANHRVGHLVHDCVLRSTVNLIVINMATLNGISTWYFSPYSY